MLVGDTAAGAVCGPLWPSLSDAYARECKRMQGRIKVSRGPGAVPKISDPSPKGTQFCFYGAMLILCLSEVNSSRLVTISVAAQ